MSISLDNLEKSIADFKERIKEEPDFCQELCEYAELKLMALKYCYYVLNIEIEKDYAYDLQEKQWYIMGRALGYLNEEDFSPCVGWNPEHPLAEEAIVLAKKWARVD